MLKAMLCLSLGVALGVTGCKRSDRDTGDDGSSELNNITDNSGKKAKYIRTEPLTATRLDENETRKVGQIFYFADTLEPYMQGAVAHEIRALKEACASHDEKVNWVAFVNSYLASKTYLKCDGGKFSKEVLDIPNLEQKIAAISAGDFDPSLKNSKDPRTALFDKALALKHPKELNVHYKAQPFVHPEIMKTIMSYAMTEIFNAKDYVYFVTLKGHGSKKFALTGLTEAQLAKKVAQQTEALDKAKNDFAGDIKAGEAGLDVSTATDAKLGRLWLGQLRPRNKFQQERLSANTGLNADIPGLNADIPGLNADIPGLNADITGLNADITGLNADITGLNADIPGLSIDDTGLGADNHFGMTIDGYMSALRIALVSAREKAGVAPKLAFLNVESCETNLRGDIGDTTSMLAVLNVKPYIGVVNYAEGSLWYRSYDWNNILYAWLDQGGSPAKLQQTMLDVGRKVVNFKFD